MKKYFALLLACFLFSISPIATVAQTSNYTVVRYPMSQYGILVNFNLNSYNADIRQLPTIEDSIPRFAFGSSVGYTLGAFYEFNFTRRVSLMLRGIYSFRDAEIKGDESNKKLIINNEEIDSLTVTHQINSNLSSIRLEPLLKFKVFYGLSLFGGANFGIGFQRSFEHKVTIISPLGQNFENGTNTRQFDADLPDVTRIHASLIGGAGYEFPIDYNGTFLIGAEILYEAGYADVVKDFSIDVNSFRTGITVKYSPRPTISRPLQEEFKSREYIDTIKMEISGITENYIKPGTLTITYDTTMYGNKRIVTESLVRTDTLFSPQIVEVNEPEQVEITVSTKDIFGNKVNVTAVAVEDETEFPLTILHIEEFQSTNMQPLLNYLFFAQNSDELPTRYKRMTQKEAQSFYVDSLFNLPTLEQYYNLLNIIGRRLTDNSKAKITLIGCNSDIDEEKGNIGLSNRRAMAVASYLTFVWDIDSDRIIIKARNLPEKASNVNDEDGITENRRVEITSNTYEIIAPVITYNNTLRVTKPPIIRFVIKNDNTNVSEWKLYIIQSGKSIKTFTGSGELPTHLDWHINEEKETIPRQTSQLEYWLETEFENGKKVKSNIGKITLDVVTIEEKHLNKTGDKKIDRYSLILFDFNESSLNSANNRIVDFINKRLAQNSKVTIEGFTDRMGEDSYNLELSKARAKAVRSALNITDVSDTGFGESILIYDNDLPEGRFYCRTVVITVETPLDK